MVGRLRLAGDVAGNGGPGQEDAAAALGEAQVVHRLRGECVPGGESQVEGVGPGRPGGVHDDQVCSGGEVLAREAGVAPRLAVVGPAGPHQHDVEVLGAGDRRREAPLRDGREAVDPLRPRQGPGGLAVGGSDGRRAPDGGAGVGVRKGSDRVGVRAGPPCGGGDRHGAGVGPARQRQVGGRDGAVLVGVQPQGGDEVVGPRRRPRGDRKRPRHGVGPGVQGHLGVMRRVGYIPGGNGI